jgi:hypothetical protein
VKEDIISELKPKPQRFKNHCLKKHRLHGFSEDKPLTAQIL